MDYNKFIDDVQQLGFIEDKQTADSAVKAVLGTMVSRLGEDQAREFAGGLPEPLSYDELVGHQQRKLDIGIREFEGVIGTQFKLNEEQCDSLVKTVIHDAKETIPRDRVQDIEKNLPSDWREFIDNA